MASQRSGTGRAVALRSRAFSLAKICSIGLNSGLWAEGRAAGRLDPLAHAADLVSLQVVEDHDVAGPQYRDKAVGDVVAKALAIGGAIREVEGAQAGGAQSGGESGRFVMALGHEEPAVLAARGAAVATGHVGGGRRRVEEDELVGVEVRLSREPRLTRRLHIGPLLLSCVQRPILRVIPCLRVIP